MTRKNATEFILIGLKQGSQIVTTCSHTCPFKSVIVLDVNLGAISRLETISVQSHGENTRGMEIVCKVRDWLTLAWILQVGDMAEI